MILKGQVVAFDENKCVGVVQVDLEIYKFHSTTFRSISSFRWPRAGEQVEVFINQHNHLVSITGA